MRNCLVLCCVEMCPHQPVENFSAVTMTRGGAVEISAANRRTVGRQLPRPINRRNNRNISDNLAGLPKLRYPYSRGSTKSFSAPAGGPGTSTIASCSLDITCGDGWPRIQGPIRPRATVLTAPAPAMSPVPARTGSSTATRRNPPRPRRHRHRRLRQPASPP
jgi:hypothetical protein